jgi:Arc/MetJ-type ribon-helix-helix transcriptional regulator
MQKEMNLNVRIRGHLQAFVASNTGEDGLYDNASEYVRDLIRKDLARTEQAAFDAKRLALQQAFATPEESYRSTSVAEVIGRNQRDT